MRHSNHIATHHQMNCNMSSAFANLDSSDKFLLFNQVFIGIFFLLHKKITARPIAATKITYAGLHYEQW